ncbi:hypothetical protein GDO78_020442 [Eleutherodactylus coqui]|uniref:Uncharacterized protein n=1 Tax=Eleutherodactylus coqui TaxID=57060 RepID=A0A8J6BII8_ELECQ|nr:hypothetical protein GDO78_020442 [Eleutherodactylus coqui]
MSMDGPRVGQLPSTSMEAIRVGTTGKWSMLRFFIRERKPELVSTRVYEESLFHSMVWRAFSTEHGGGRPLWIPQQKSTSVCKA